MKLILMGTPSFVVPIFDKVADAHEVVAVFTRAPKPVGRKQIITKSPVHIWAENRGIKVYTNINEFNNPEIQNQKSTINYILVISYGVILRENVLNFAPCINIHPSDLPKYRGPSPIITAIYNGDEQSAVCLMQIVPEIDSGDILMRQEFIIGENETLKEIESKVSEISTSIVLEYLRTPEKYPPVSQIGIPSFTRKFTGKDEVIDWSQSSKQIHNQVRSITGRTKINGIDVKILETKIIDGKLEILRIQPAGKKPMRWTDFKNGLRGEKIEIGK
ncbi:MAG: methionyl-tRNA formyltransferase [Alphaproteobacteria bacterium]|jgi:methionyl-tRNA formyltransferase|nr:methionyl-tRNA formyltransferase [Alphaproteobacteria bacterium]